MPKHYLIFIHGIGELEENDFVSKDQESHSPRGYAMLWNLLIKQSGRTPEDFNQKFGRIDVVWHGGKLHSAEEALSKTAFPNLKPRLWRPMDRLRNFMNFFIGDVIAYVSEDVNFIRRTAWEQIWSYCDAGKPFKQLLEEGATYSIVAHSLGTVIAFDYLFELFFDPQKPKLFVPIPDAQKRPEDDHLTDKDRELAVAKDEDLQVLKNQFRHFFSMGSPIGLFLMRKGSLWAEGEPFEKVYNPVRGDGRAWCNFWDSDDPIAYPVKQLFGKNPENDPCKLLDIPVETGWIFSAHVDYWKNRTVANEIMRWIAESC